MWNHSKKYLFYKNRPLSNLKLKWISRYFCLPHWAKFRWMRQSRHQRCWHSPSLEQGVRPPEIPSHLSFSSFLSCISSTLSSLWHWAQGCYFLLGPWVEAGGTWRGRHNEVCEPQHVQWQTATSQELVRRARCLQHCGVQAPCETVTAAGKEDLKPGDVSRWLSAPGFSSHGATTTETVKSSCLDRGSES